MSPEQVQGNKEVDSRSDLWAIGVIAFEALTGKKPFISDGLGDLVLQICVRPAPIPSEAAPVPPGFDEWFARATARNPDDRFQSARDMVERLRELLGEGERETIVTVPEEESIPASAPVASERPASDAAAAAQETQADVQREPVSPDAPTVHQFETGPAPKVFAGRRLSRVAAVAAAGLLAGIALVVAWARYERSINLEPPSQIPRATEPAVAAGASVTKAAVEHRPEPNALREDAGLDAGSLAQSPVVATDTRSAEVLQPADGSIVDAGADVWVKPEWALPDEEPIHFWDPNAPAEPEEPAGSQLVDGPIENPY
jgi:serine/threonine-protein kinase